LPRILGLDPGGTTGWAIVEYDETTMPLLQEHGQIENGHEGFIEAWPHLPQHDVIVCESFTLREGIRGVNIEPAYVIGALEALTIDTIFYQTPSYKTLCDNDALKRLNMYVKGKQHTRDAIRHSVIYLKTKKKHKPTINMGWVYDEET